MDVRRAKHGDEAEIERIVSEATRRAAGEPHASDIPVLLRRDAAWWVAEIDGHVVGAAAVGKGPMNCLDIQYIATEDGAQDKGVGLELARFLLNWLSTSDSP